MKNRSFHLNLDRYSSAANTLELSLLARQVDDRPHAAVGTIKSGLAPMDVVPGDASVLGSFQRFGGADVYAEASDYLVLVQSWTDETFVTVAAATHERASEVLTFITEASGPGESEHAEEVAFWRFKANGGGKRSGRTVPTRPWSEIERNYPRTVRSQLGALMNRREVGPGEGRLILFHGEPGTGKTTAIRALIHQWSSWCEAHLVTDPDRMFVDSEYLINVIQSQEGQAAPTVVNPPGVRKWKLIVAEDADAYLRSSARLDAGAALGRLLNTTDGLLGQSTKAIVLLTTNEELTRLHPALIRPGRCLARTEFVRFSAEEARAWIGNHGPSPTKGATLAELFESRRTENPISISGTLTGAYL